MQELATADCLALSIPGAGSHTLSGSQELIPRLYL